jgi:hypothetical protein
MFKMTLEFLAIPDVKETSSVYKGQIKRTQELSWVKPWKDMEEPQVSNTKGKMPICLTPIIWHFGKDKTKGQGTGRDE